ncbi:MAG: ferrous iron transport protein A [Ruminococcus sp.]|nr:ferrous iron transport protein A [Ruminococcus sp.]
MNIIYLSQLKEGESCTVQSLEISGAMRYRLSELGFISGSDVTCLQKSFSGDPTAYFVRGAVIALRKNDASRIKIAVP